MSGLMNKHYFTRYMESLEDTRMQAPLRKVKIDYKALLKYAKKRVCSHAILRKKSKRDL